MTHRELPPVVAPARYVLLPLAELMTGYTVKAMARKIERGDWQEGKVWRRAPDGRILIDVQGFQRWVEICNERRQRKGKDRIQFDFEGQRYRPTLKRIPNEATSGALKRSLTTPTYAAWLDGTTESDLRAIKSAMDGPCTASIPAVKLQAQKPSRLRAGTSDFEPRSWH